MNRSGECCARCLVDGQRPPGARDNSARTLDNTSAAEPADILAVAAEIERAAVVHDQGIANGQRLIHAKRQRALVDGGLSTVAHPACQSEISGTDFCQAASSAGDVATDRAIAGIVGNQLRIARGVEHTASDAAAAIVNQRSGIERQSLTEVDRHTYTGGEVQSIDQHAVDAALCSGGFYCFVGDDSREVSRDVTRISRDRSASAAVGGEVISEKEAGDDAHSRRNKRGRARRKLDGRRAAAVDAHRASCCATGKTVEIERAARAAKIDRGKSHVHRQNTNRLRECTACKIYSCSGKPKRLSG